MVRTNIAKFTNMMIARFRKSRYLVRESKVFIKDKPRLQAEWAGMYFGQLLWEFSESNGGVCCTYCWIISSKTIFWNLQSIVFLERTLDYQTVSVGVCWTSPLHVVRSLHHQLLSVKTLLVVSTDFHTVLFTQQGEVRVTVENLDPFWWICAVHLLTNH